MTLRTLSFLYFRQKKENPISAHNSYGLKFIYFFKNKIKDSVSGNIIISRRFLDEEERRQK